MTAVISEYEPLAYTVKDAIQIASISKTLLYKLIAEKKLEKRKIGKRTLITATSLHRLIEQGI